MKKGNSITRTVATFILKKILINNEGLEYVCKTWERFSAISQVLRQVALDIDPRREGDKKILKNVLTCFLKLSEKPANKDKLRKFIPEEYINNIDSFTDEQNRTWLRQIKQNLGIAS